MQYDEWLYCLQSKGTVVKEKEQQSFPGLADGYVTAICRLYQNDLHDHIVGSEGESRARMAAESSQNSDLSPLRIFTMSFGFDTDAPSIAICKASQAALAETATATVGGKRRINRGQDSILNYLILAIPRKELRVINVLIDLRDSTSGFKDGAIKMPINIEWKGRIQVGMSNSLTTPIRGNVRDMAIGKTKTTEKADRATVEQEYGIYFLQQIAIEEGIMNIHLVDHPIPGSC
ncbi:hypothetical protein CQW23_34195 [Capsicum baccatum]|uniref:Uncharacterized protein n=1 Tax=Capsicum baccatum TaxID=33114 RepID=A0A2G2UZX1_CAPBA|nr:hypothetical protein CQW23_34195 [Capsicum baccatum]